MSETTNASIRYERPAIERRDSIAGLADATAPSDVANDGLPGPTGFPGTASDVNVKENIRPVRW